MFNDLIYKKDSESNSEGFADPRCLMFAAEHTHKRKQQNIMCNNDYGDIYIYIHQQYAWLTIRSVTG